MLTAEQKIVLNVLSIALLKSLPTQVLSPLTVPQSKAIVVGRPGHVAITISCKSDKISERR